MTSAHPSAQRFPLQVCPRIREDDWSRVMFSDERYAKCNIVGTVPCVEGAIMVCDGINLHAKTDLHVFPRVT